MQKQESYCKRIRKEKGRKKNKVIENQYKRQKSRKNKKSRNIQSKANQDKSSNQDVSQKCKETMREHKRGKQGGP